MANRLIGQVRRVTKSLQDTVRLYNGSEFRYDIALPKTLAFADVSSSSSHLFTEMEDMVRVSIKFIAAYLQ